MGLGSRDARRHETARTAGVRPEDYYDFTPGQTVMTVDGFLGKVLAVNDGPWPGSEEYEVSLLNDMGGGIYTSSQLRASTDHSASTENTAALDYPELAEVLSQRPDPGKYPDSTLGLTASLQKQAGSFEDAWAKIPTDPHDTSQCVSRKDNPTYCLWHKADHLETDGEPRGDVDGHGNPVGEQPDLPRCDLCDGFHDSLHHYSETEANNGYREDDSALDGIDPDDDGRQDFTGRHAAQASPPGLCDNGHLTWGGVCPACRDADPDQNAMVVNPGDNKPNPGVIAKTADLHVTADWYYSRSKISGDPIVHPAGQPVKGGRPGLDVGDHVLFDSGHSARIKAVTPTLLHLEGHSPMHRGPIEGDHSQSIWSSDSIEEAGQDVPAMPEGAAQMLDSNPHGPTRYSTRRTAGTGDWHPWSSLCEEDPENEGFCGYHHEHHEDEDENCIAHDHSPEPYCEKCGVDGHDESVHTTMCHRCDDVVDHEGNHVSSQDGTCPNEPRTEDDVFDGLDPSKYCGEHCQSGHASDIHHGIMGHHTFVRGEREYAGHGTPLSNITGPHDAPADRDSRYEVRDPDAEGLCHYCRKPLPDSPLRALDDLGSPQERHFLKTNPTGPTKYSVLDEGYALVRAAALSPSLAFHVTAAWRDVQAKAKAIRTKGGVRIVAVQSDAVVAQVQGDHNVYQSSILRAPGSQKVATWECGCKWAAYSWGRKGPYKKYEGRMCSHALALHYEAQSQGMFGGQVAEQPKAPKWMRRHTPVVVAYDPDRQINVAASLDHDTPLRTFVSTAMAQGEDPEEIGVLLSTVTASVNSPFGEPGPHPITNVPGPTAPRNPSENPASAGPLTAADPQGWGEKSPSSMGDRYASLDDALFEPEIAKEAWAQVVLPIARQLLISQAPKLLGGDDDQDPQPDANLPGTPGTQQAPEQQAEQRTQQADAEGTGVRTLLDQQAEQHRANPWHASLNEEPEPALPSTDGAAEDEQTWSGYAGDPEPDQVIATSVMATSVPTGTTYATDGSTGHNPAGQVTNPGLGLISVDDEVLSPESPSVQTVGSVSDIVAEFQRTAGASALQAGPAGSSKDTSDIATAAAAFLQKTAMAEFSPAQQKELIDEGEGVLAGNFASLQIAGTHYQPLEEALKSSEAADDDEGWLS